VNRADLNGWLRGWKAVGIIAGALISAGVVLGWVGRTVGQASDRAVGRIVEIVSQRIANDSTRSTRADARTLNKINELAARQAKLEQRLNRTNVILTRTLRTVLQKPSPEEKKRLLASVGVDTSAKAAPRP